jgi:replicative DNA helicase
MSREAPLFGLLPRLPPVNVEAEQALLGALLANNKAYDRVSKFLEPKHFADPIHGRIFQAIARRVDAGQIADSVTLKAEFEHAGILDEVGGTAYLTQLLTAMVGIINAGDYGLAVRDCWVRRELIDAGETLINEAYGVGAPVDVGRLAAEAVQAIERVSGMSTDSHSTTLDAAMDAALDAMDAKASAGIVSTGFRCLDMRLGGLEPGHVYVVAGRPGMGKSALGHQIAINAARTGVGVLELSLEMSAVQLGRRALCSASGVPLSVVKRGRAAKVTADHAAALVMARKEIGGLPLTIDDAGGQTPRQIATKARLAKRKHGLGLVMVDHLNLTRPEEGDAKHGPTHAIERASGMMLQIAKDCGVPVLLLAQLSRGVESRDDHRPTLGDLRQSGAIEQDAYAVGFVYREEYYLRQEAIPEQKDNETADKFASRKGAFFARQDRAAGKAEVIWAKVRDGEPGTDQMRFDGKTASFKEDYDG